MQTQCSKDCKYYSGVEKIERTTGKNSGAGYAGTL